VRRPLVLAAALCVTQPAWPANGDALVDAYLAAWNGATDRLEAHLDPQFVDRSTLVPADAHGLALRIAHWRTAVPDLEVTLVERLRSPGREALRLRLEGHPADPDSLMPLSAGTLAIERTDWLTVIDGRLKELRTVVDEWSLPPELQFVAPASLPRAELPARTLATFPAGSFLESIAVSPDGRLFVSTGPEGAIVTIGSDGEIRPFARVPVGPGGFVMCLAFGPDGKLYASVLSATADVHGIWRFESDGRGARFAALPPDTVPNGITLDGRGGLLVADSVGGIIWRVELDTASVRPWLRDERFTARPLVGTFPGINGIQRAGDTVFVTVSDRSLLMRIPLRSDGGAGEPDVVSGSLAGDDFAIAPDGSLYVTTHPFNTVVRVTPEGRQVVVAGPRQGVVGPTAAAIGADGALYVTTDGGLYRSLAGVPIVPGIVRIELPAPSIADASALRLH